MLNKNVLLAVDLGKNGGKKSFFTEDELRDWLLDENSFYGWLNQARGLHNNAPAIAEHVFSHLAALNSQYGQVTSTTDETQKTAYLNQLKSSIEAFYNNNLLLHSNTPSANFINRLNAKNPILAIHALGFLVGNTGNSAYWTNLSIDGFNEAWAFRNGIKSSENEKENLDQLRIEIKDVLNDISLEKTDLTNSFQEIHQNIIKEKTNQSSEHAILINEYKDNLDKLISDSNERLTNIEQAYDKHMALQSSVEYWSSRSSHHKTEGKKYLRLTGLIALLGISLLIFLSYNLLDLESIKAVKNNSPLTVTDIPLWHISIIILTASIFIWAARILVRLLLSNLHLETDAGERVVMAKTYIAMLREGQAPKDDDRKLILASLFRPNMTGIINDDAMPFNLDAMQKIIGGKS